MSRLVGLYPRAWRDRYEAEFLELIAERPPTLAGGFDILRGAVDARLHPQVRRSVDPSMLPSPVPDADLRLARGLGIAALFGIVAWLAAFAVVLMGPIAYDGDGAYRDGSAAFPIFLLAVVLISAGLLGQAISLPTNARFARGSALLAIPFLLLFGMAPWMWPFGLGFIGALVVLGMASLRSGAWPLWASLAVVVAGLSVVALIAVGVTVAAGDRMAGGAYFVLAGLVLVPAWLGLGTTLIRRPMLSATSRP